MVLFLVKPIILLALLAKSVDALYEEGCGPLTDITNGPVDVPNPDLLSVDRYDPRITMMRSDEPEDCDYTFKLRFKHDPTLNFTKEQCEDSSFIAADGLPPTTGRSRWTFMKVPDHIKAVTGLDHISIDFGGCGGHGGDLIDPKQPEPWRSAHYDLHMYYVTPEYRTCMKLDAPFNELSAQTTPNGIAFFNPARLSDGSLSNMPANYELTLNSPFSGGHAWDPADEVKADIGWDFPAILMSPYNGKIVTFEPMIPIVNLMGDKDQKFEIPLTYVAQTMKELPNKFVLEYSAVRGYSTVTLTGKSLVCRKNTGGGKGTCTKKGKKSPKCP